MTTFKYKAISKDGAPVTGVLDAYDEFEAVAKIKEDCTIITKIEPIPEKRERIDLNEPLWVSDKVLSLVSSQFAILLRAGLPIARTVEIVGTQVADRLMKKILRQVAEDVTAGYSLAQSFENHGKKLPATFIETVRAGEESGTLETSFAKLEAYYQKTYKIKSKVKSAMTYPLFLSILAVAVVVIIVSFVLPNIMGMVISGSGEMPLPTKILLSITNFFKSWWWLLAILLVGSILFCQLYKKTEQGRTIFAKIALKLPVLGKINLMKGSSQFANTMSTLLSAGLPVTRALTVTGRVMDNYSMGQEVGKLTVGVEEGKRVGEVLRGAPYFPPLLVEMTAVGEESGSLEETLDTIGAYFDSEVQSASNRALSLLEPIITVVMGIVVGFLVIALYMPMFSMYSGIGA